MNSKNFLKKLFLGATLSAIIFFAAADFIHAQNFDSEQNAFSYKKSGDDALQNHNLPLAIDYYRKALQKNPNFLPALISLASTLQEIGDLQQALDAIETAYRLDSKNAKVLLVKANALLKMNNFAEAEKIAQEGLRFSPQTPEFQFILTKSYLHKGNISVAQDKAEKLIRSAPNFAPAYILMGEILTEQKRFDKALEYYQKARLIEPQNSDIFVQMSVTEMKKTLYQNQETLQSKIDGESFKKAISSLESAMAFDSKHVTSNFLLGQIYALGGDCAKALPFLQTVLEVNPTHAGALDYLSLCQPEKSAEMLRTLLYQNQNDDLLRFSYEWAILHSFARREHPANMENVRYHLNNTQLLLSSNYLEAAYELLWSEFLNPDFAYTHERLLSHYRNTKDYENYIRQLNLLRRRENNLHTGSRYQDYFEIYTRERPRHLYYRMGIEQPSAYKTEVPIFIFFPKAKSPFSSHPLSGLALAESISFYLQNLGKMRVADFAQRQKIYRELSPTNSATQGVHYSTANASKVAKIFSALSSDETLLNKYSSDLKKPFPLDLRYVLDGSFQEIKDGIEVSVRLIDLKSGKTFAPYSVRSTGRGYLRKISMSIAEHIFKNVSPTGYIIKVNNSNIVVNLGFRDGITKNQIFGVYRDGRLVSKIKVVETDHDMLLATPVEQGDIFLIQNGDSVQAMQPEAPEEKKQRKN